MITLVLIVSFVYIFVSRYALWEGPIYTVQWPWFAFEELLLSCQCYLLYNTQIESNNFAHSGAFWSAIDDTYWNTTNTFLPTSWSQKSLHFCSISKSLSSSLLSSRKVVIANEDIRYQEPFCDIYVNT